MTRCSYASKYRGLVAPSCNGGDPCDACRETFSKVSLDTEELFPNDDYIIARDYMILGQLVPVDVQARLLVEGIDVVAMERKYGA